MRRQLGRHVLDLALRVIPAKNPFGLCSEQMVENGVDRKSIHSNPLFCAQSLGLLG
jgi:hypothetical protein